MEERRAAADSAEGRTILFYDGPCGLCQRAVVWILEHERRAPSEKSSEQLLFAPLEGRTAETHLPAPLRTPPYDGVVLLEADGRTRIGIDAVHALARFIRFPWSVVLRVAPARGYRFIVRRRAAIACRLPACQINPTDRMLG
jgi:predicted DCC family thiol-disulfide oxidoreductase YuxK